MPKLTPNTITITAIDSFTYHQQGSNPAGVFIVPEDALSVSQMLAIAKKVGFSETAFIKILTTEEDGELTTEIRYFTPESEVPLCGHATVAAFYHLEKEGYFLKQTARAHTGAGCIEICRTNAPAPFNESLFWMTQGTPIFEPFPAEHLAALYHAFDQPLQDSLHPQLPIIIGTTGLRDIIIPIKSREILNNLKMLSSPLAKLSSALNVTGAHLFCIDEDEVYARNFAPLYGIDEESATGTSNGVLISYLHHYMYPEDNTLLRYIKQGEAMHVLSMIVARSTKTENGYAVRVGGACSERDDKITVICH